MTRGFSRWIWPLELPSRTLHPKVQPACHALALDDERATFHPVLWTEEGEHDVYPWLLTADTGDSRSCWFRDERISQVWFAGSHSNVGGGYPDDALAYIPLHWMMEEARIRGLAFKAPPADPDAFRRAASARDKDGRQYDSRAGVACYYRYGPRKIADLCNMRLPKYLGDSVRIELPKIHETALLRLRSGGNAYAPIGIPAEYAVAMSDGRILRGADNPYETPNQAAGRAADQERIWNLVWLRRIVYFATVIASFHLAAFWLFHDLVPQREFESPVKLVSEFVRLVESFLPRQVVHLWTDYYAANPISFLLGVIAVAVVISIGSRLGSKIADSMRIIWNARAPHATTKISIPHSMIYAFRTSKPYQWELNSARHHVLPFLSAIFLLWLGAGALSHFLFNVFDSAGVFCLRRTRPSWRSWKVTIEAPPRRSSFQRMRYASQPACGSRRARGTPSASRRSNRGWNAACNRPIRSGSGFWNCRTGGWDGGTTRRCRCAAFSFGPGSMSSRALGPRGSTRISSIRVQFPAARIMWGAPKG
jgi:T6SS, Phospholipase effector Tle1-like, catalytic domain